MPASAADAEDARSAAADAWRRAEPASRWRAAAAVVEAALGIAVDDSALGAADSTGDAAHWAAFLSSCITTWRARSADAEPLAAAFRASPCAPSAKHLTLLLLRDGDRLLLGRKKRGFGAGKLNGFGGKVDPGETLLAAALREMHEESGVELRRADVAHVGFLAFTFDSAPDARLDVHVFTATSRAPVLFVESEEMAPAWFDARAPPLAEMWADDALWLPRVLAGARVRGAFRFADHSTIVRFTLAEVPVGEPVCPHIEDAATAVLVPAGAPKQGAIDV